MGPGEAAGRVSREHPTRIRLTVMSVNVVNMVNVKVTLPTEIHPPVRLQQRQRPSISEGIHRSDVHNIHHVHCKLRSYG
jgi:hypothetical protein